jgi:hypothetical protein
MFQKEPICPVSARCSCLGSVRRTATKTGCGTHRLPSPGGVMFVTKCEEIVSVYPPVLGVTLRASAEGLLGLQSKSLSFVSLDVFR